VLCHAVGSRQLTMDIGTLLTISLRGRLIGRDVLRNRYYLEKSQRRGSLRARRWAVRRRKGSLGSARVVARLVALHHRHAIAGNRQASLAEATCSERHGHSVGLSSTGP